MMSFIDKFEPAALCLLASLIWAPVVLAGALRLDRGRSLAASEVLWVSALFLAVLPTLIAPGLSAAGLSLRPAKVIEISAPVVADVAPKIAAVTKPTAAAALAAEPATLDAEMMLNVAALIYLYGALLALGAWLVRGALFARQVRAAEPVDHPALLNALNDFAARLGVVQTFELRRSEAISTVCVFGYFKPVILLPRDIDARVSFDDLALMGAHELAHVKRGDAALYTFAALLRIVFWFNPFVRQIAARAELAAEQGADALVLSQGADRRRYAACFIEGLKFAAERAQVARFATPSFTPFDRQSRRDRLNAILTGEMRRGRPLKVMVALALLIAGGAAFAQAGLAVAPETKIARSGPVMIDTREGKPMRTPFDGVVVTATDVYRGKPSWGKTVVVKHDDGRSTTFARLASYSVKKGDEVRRGDQIGVAGKDPLVTIDTGADEARAAPPAPLARLSPTAPVTAAPLPLPAEVAEPAPAAPAPPAPAAIDLNDELDGAEPPSPPDPPSNYSFVSPPGTAYIFETDEGGSRVVFMKRDGTIAGSDGRELSDEEKKHFEKKFRELKKNMEKAREARSQWSWQGEFDAAALEKLREEASIDAKKISEMLKHQGLSVRELERIQRDAMRDAERAFERSRDALQDGWSAFAYQNGCDDGCREEARREAEEARREAQQEREQARREAEAEREQARAEAEAEREQALAEAQAEREQALAEAEAEREEAMAEAEAAREEAQAARQEADEERRQIEDEIRERAAALADAERDLAQERADLERLKAELAAKKNDDRVW